MRFLIVLPALMVSCVFLLAPSALAQVDTSTPKAAIKTLYTAIEKADQATILQVLMVSDDPQQDIAKAYSNMLLASKRFGDIAKQKFPGVASTLAQPALAPEDIARIDSAVVTVDGDTATVKLSAATAPATLKRVNGAWRMAVDSAPASGPSDRRQQLVLIQGLSDAIQQSADEMNADKYASIQDVENVLKQRMGVVLNKALQANPPTSRPATQPR